MPIITLIKDLYSEYGENSQNLIIKTWEIQFSKEPLNHWTTGEVPKPVLFLLSAFCSCVCAWLPLSDIFIQTTVHQTLSRQAALKDGDLVLAEEEEPGRARKDLSGALLSPTLEAYKGKSRARQK